MFAWYSRLLAGLRISEGLPLLLLRLYLTPVLLQAGWNTVFCGRRKEPLEAAIASAGEDKTKALAIARL